ncbi:uncharacterized protein LOC132601299 [Lycium barbarum]|uniref:uncharacterized protein LOC132601299 n=1 Tax=Lycium barbarum TaxID=112863 RepID=UPI00293F24C7|nr:uncharacterized protein LOC132601299 [Lycium barbarum]
MGDFNVIMESSVKKGFRSHRFCRSLGFSKCMEECGMMDAGFSGNNFTWTNGRRMRNRIMKRLDRVMYNDKWLEEFSIVTVRHLPRTASDHNTILLKCALSDTPPIRYLKFLNFWTDQIDFKDIVKNNGRNMSMAMPCM